MKIGLIQINNSFSGQNYLPYSTACLESYLREHSEKKSKLEFLPHIYKRAPIYKIVAAMEKADLVGFSTYVWNAQISLETARRIKEKWPEKLIIFGGPQVPDDPREFLENNAFIDLVVHNEGERTFKTIIDMLPEKDWSNVTGVSFFDHAGNFHTNEPTPRIRDLSEVPSPFINGIFDKLVEDNPDEKWIGLWETNRGCPFQCTFCDWGSATAAKVTKFEEERLEFELKWMAEKKIQYVFVCDANFGIQKRDVDIAESVAKIKSETGFPQGFSVQNTKNATDRAYLTQKIIADAGLNKGVALSMQSLDETTLKNIKRDNISLDTYWELAKRFNSDKIETYSDLILPLPGETYESFCRGVDALIAAGQYNRIQFNNLSILPNAEMGSAEYLKKFGMKIQRSEIINIHGSKIENEDDVPEYQDLVVETYSMNSSDWKRARVFAWMVSFLYFNKLLQIPIVVAMEKSDAIFTEIIEAFVLVDKSKYPTLGAVSEFLFSEADNISKGGPEYVFSEEWLGIYWPADEYLYIKLTVEEKIGCFYEEALEVLTSVIKPRNLTASEEVIRDAVFVNRELLSQPHKNKKIKFKSNYNVVDFWKKTIAGEHVEIVSQPTHLEVQNNLHSFEDLNEWCQKVVWWGNKKGAYLNQCVTVSEELSGHF